MIKKNLVLILLILINSNSIAQSAFKFSKDYSILKVEPSKTDSKIKEANSPHLVVYNKKAKQGELLLFLPGTGGIATRGPRRLFSVAVYQGYHVINLSYINKPAVAQICRGKVLNKNFNCAEEFRTKRIYGNNEFSRIDDEVHDAIVNRFTKLLIYLSENDKNTDWGNYLENGKPKWGKIAVSGQSQGGGMAAFIAKENLVARVIDFSGGWDFSAKNKIANWYSSKSITPSNLWYGTYHVTEPMAKIIKESYLAMNIPESHIYAFDLKVPEGRKGHSDGVRNIGYTDQWIELLGKGN